MASLECKITLDDVLKAMVDSGYYDELFKEYDNSKWIEFNAKNKSTWPNCDLCLVATESGMVTTSFFDISINGKPVFLKIYSKLVTHWQPLPYPPK